MNKQFIKLLDVGKNVGMVFGFKDFGNASCLPGSIKLLYSEIFV